MNRQAKRMLARQQKAAPQDRAEAVKRQRAAAAEGRKRTSPRQFAKEVKLELKKVAWPTRPEIVSYTIVVLVTVVVLTSLVFGVDAVFSRVVLKLFTQGA